jgi:hypothetical protein
LGTIVAHRITIDEMAISSSFGDLKCVGAAEICLAIALDPLGTNTMRARSLSATARLADWNRGKGIFHV